MPSFQDLKRAWLLRSLGLSSGGSVNDLEAALYAVNAGAASNRRMRPGVLYRHNTGASAAATNTPLLGTIYFVPFEVGFTTAFQSIHCETTVAGTTGNTITMGIYDDVVGNPKNLLVSGSVSSGTIGELIVPITKTLNPGMYWSVLLSLTGVAPTIRTYSAHTSPWIGSNTWPGANNYSHYDFGSVGALPNPFSGSISLGGSTLCPVIMLKTAA